MLTALNKIYLYSDEWIEIDIKYGNRRLIGETKSCNITYNEDYIVLKNGKYHIFGKHNRIINFTETNFTSIIDNYLYYIEKKPYKHSVIYDLEKGISKKLNGYIECIAKFSNNRIIVYSFNQGITILESIDDFMEFINGKNVGKSINSKSLTTSIKFLDDNNFVVNKNYHIDIYDLNGKLKESFDCGNCLIKFVVVKNGIIYALSAIYISIIEGSNINTIKNTVDIRIYNHYYDVFINSKLQLFRIIDNQIIRARLNYDLWRDIGIPKSIEVTIDVLIELELFPPEIYNIVYQNLLIIEIIY